MIQCIAQRESVVYFIDVFREHLEEALDILADAVLNPALTEEEFEMAKTNMSFQRENLPPDLISRDVSFAVSSQI
jgi:predicted Zn-dependent peptidase